MIVVLVALAVVVAATAAAGRFVEPFAGGKMTRTVDGVTFTVTVRSSGWENGPHERIGGEDRTRSLYISKSTVGPQGAEAVIFWTGFPV
jgi:hypothetical protein